MSSRGVLWLGLVLAVLVGLAVLLMGDREPAGEAVGPTAVVVEDSAGTLEPLGLRAEPTGGRAVLPVAVEAGPVEVRAGAIRYRAVDLLGWAVVGERLVLEGGAELVTDEDGWIDWAGEREDLLQASAGARRVRALAFGRSRGAGPAELLLLGREARLEGYVLDPSGERAADVPVTLDAPSLVRNFPFPVELSTTLPRDQRTSSDARGNFTFEDVLAEVPVRVIAYRPSRGFAPEFARWEIASALVHDVGAAPVVLQLSAPSGVARGQSREIVIQGRVLTAYGDGVEGVPVFWQPISTATHTQAEGVFSTRISIEVDEDGFPKPTQHGGQLADLALWSRCDDAGLAREPDFGTLILLHFPASPPPFELRLAGDAGRLNGRLVGGTGDRVSEWKVFLLDPTPAGVLSTAFPETGVTQTDRQGRFSLSGLRPERDYRLALVAPDKSFAFHAGPFSPGPGHVEIPVDERSYVANLRIRAVDPEGVPLGRVQLALRCTVMRLPFGPGDVMSSEDVGTTSTDAAGYARFARVPRAEAQVVAVGSHKQRFRPTPVPLDPSEPEPTLTFERLVPILPVWSGDLRGVALNVLDGAGEPLWFYDGNLSVTTTVMHLALTPVAHYWVPVNAQTIVLTRTDPTTRQGIELGRLPLPHWPGPEAAPIRLDFGG